MTITLHFHGDLPSLLRRRWRDRQRHEIPANRAASVKDMVESFGLPHTEVGRLQVDGREVDFGYLIELPCHIDIWPASVPWHILSASLLRPHPLPVLRFLVDANVSKLGRLLRMAGFDAASHSHWHDDDLASCAEAEQRLLLSKDRGLLMRKKVQFGRFVRAIDPLGQFHEIINLLDLHDQMQPLSRCLECNSPLEEISKAEIAHLLEPLTRKYYQEFSRCPSCAKIYWPGSHVEKMLMLLPVRHHFKCPPRKKRN